MNTTTIARKRAAEAVPPKSGGKPHRRRRPLRDLPALRRLAADQIDRLIAFLDETDPFVQTEREEDGAEQSDHELTAQVRRYGHHLITDDNEPSLCGVTASGLAMPYFGIDDSEEECEDEGADGADDRELVCEDEGAEHDGSEPDLEGEPSLGWTVDGVMGCVTEFGADREADGSYLTEAAQDRYKIADRWVINRDGRHVDTERGFALNRRLRNLSEGQSKLIKPRIDRTSGVSVSS